MNTNNKTPKGLLINRLGDILHDSDGLLSLVKLNLLFLFSSGLIIFPVAVFTSGPSVTALLQCTNIMVKKGYVHNIREVYFSSFRKGGKKAVKSGAVFLTLFLLFSFGLSFYLKQSSQNIIYIPFASVSLLAIIFMSCIATHIFPLLADDSTADKSLKEIFSLGIVLAFQNMMKTLVSVVVSYIFMIAIILFIPASLPLFLTLAFSVPALCAAFAHSTPDIPEL